MEKQFLDLFGICFAEPPAQVLSEAALLQLEVEREKREMTVTVHPEELLDKKLLFEAEQAIAQALS